LTAQVLAVLPEVEREVPELPRLADFALILAAIDKVMDWTTLADFRATSAELLQAVIETDPFATAVRAFVMKNRAWTGTAAALLEMLTPTDGAPKNWPANPRALSGRLRRVGLALRTSGIDTQFEHTKDARINSPGSRGRRRVLKGTRSDRHLRHHRHDHQRTPGHRFVGGDAKTDGVCVTANVTAMTGDANGDAKTGHTRVCVTAAAQLNACR